MSESIEKSAKNILDACKTLKLCDANEAETRFKIIDRIIFEILGWLRDDITVEERVEEDGKTEITDYVFRTATTLFVIEAKRVGKCFENYSGSNRFLLSKTNVTGDFGKAIIQARDYCRKSAIPFAVVTNGDTWCIFPASRIDGVTFAQSSAVVFENLNLALSDELETFIGLLGRDSVLGGSLERKLTGAAINQLNGRRLNTRYGRSTPKIEKAQVFELVEHAFLTALNPEIAFDNVDMLREGYVATEARIRFDKRIQMHVRRRENVTQRSALKAVKPSGAKKFTAALEDAKSRSRPIAILLLGPVGSGKSTFLQYVRFVSGTDFFEKRKDRPYPHWFHIDYREFTESQDARAFLLQALLSKIDKEEFLSSYELCLRHAFADNIESLFRGPLSLFANDEDEKKKQITGYLVDQYKKVEPYVLHILKYAARHAPVFLVIDNVDQIESSKSQENIFSEAMALAHACNLNLILSMRDSTYVNNRSTPTFDAFDYDPVSIDPPPVEAVLARRFSIAEELSKGHTGEFVAENGAKVVVSDCSLIVSMLRESVLGTEIGRQIEILAAGDIRLALRMTREFLQYGYSATGKAFKIYSSKGKYRLPPHEAMRAIMLGNQPVYKEAFSVLANIFDSRIGRSELQLARMYILSALVVSARSSRFQFVIGADIAEKCKQIGFSEVVTQTVLSDLIKARFAFTLSQGPATFDARFVPSRLGGHIINRYLADFVYLENTLMDTFISDEDIWNNLSDLSGKILRERNIIKRLELRKARVQTFFGLMTDQYKPFIIESRKRGLPPEWCSDPMGQSRSNFERNITRITSSANRNYGEKE